MPARDLILALDQGTSSSRAILFDHEASPIAVAQRPITQSFPYPGWVNQDPLELLNITLGVAKEVIASSGKRPEHIAAIGITNQRETTILWERASGHPVAPAIVWQSRQTANLVDGIQARGMSDVYQHITGLVPDAYFSATKIAWLLDCDADLRQRAEQGEILFGTVDSWLLWHMSGQRLHVTDASNASRTMLYDIREGQWSESLLADLQIPHAMLPTVRDNAEILFETPADLFGVPIPVAASIGDQQSALFGHACFMPGQAKNTYGTGSFVLMNTGAEPKPSMHRLLTTIAWRTGGVTEFALEGSIFTTGAAVQWLRDGLGIIEAAPEIERLADSVPTSGGVVFVPALTGLGAPYWDQHARGTIVGLTSGTSRTHLARATLEAIAFQTRDVLEAMSRDSQVAVTELRVDGGAARNNLLLQIQADILGVPVVRPRVIETTALGAAYLAGLAIGFWPDRDALATLRQVDRRFEPSLDTSRRELLYATWLRAVDRARAWAEDEPI